METCSRCGQLSGKTYSAFGKKICKTCRDTRPRKGLGHSGMNDNPQLSIPMFGSGVALDLVPKGDGMFGNLYFSHYPGSKGIVGRCLCYNIYLDGEIAGVIGVSSPPKNYRYFNKYFGKDTEKFFVNNNIFRLINHERNLGSRVLSAMRKRVYRDYQNKYGDTLLGIVTFVEKPRTGAVYMADNWEFLGMTEGIRMRRNSISWEKEYSKGEQKYVYGYKYKEKK